MGECKRLVSTSQFKCPACNGSEGFYHLLIVPSVVSIPEPVAQDFDQNQKFPDI